MKPVWLKVDWDVPTHYSEESIIVHPKSVTVVEDLEIENGVYCATEYNRVDAELLSIGIIAAPPIQKIKAVGKFSFKREMTEWESGIWVSCPVYEWNRTERQYVVSVPSLGVNQCGTFWIDGIVSENHQTFTCEVKVRPSLLSEEEYKLMEQDLLSITEELMYKQEMNHGGTEGKSSLIDLGAVSQSVQSFLQLLTELEKAPAEKLTQERRKTSYEKLRKLDVRTLLEKELYPYLETVHAITTVQSLDVVEHRKLKGVILEFLLICERNKNRELEMQKSITNQLSDIKDQKSKLNDRDNWAAPHFSNKENFLSSQFNMLSKRSIVWEEIIRELEDLLESGLFYHCEPEEWGETHLFIYHPQYSEAFELVERLQKELRQNHVALRDFQRDLLHSPDLYEKWVFFKTLYYFTGTMKFTPQGRNVMEEILTYYETHKKLKGFRISLVISPSTKLVIGSEVRFDNNRRPDIALRFDQPNKQSLVFLDAKYKPYSKLTEQLERDLDHSAKQYREMDARGKAAFLVHPDEERGNHFEITRPHRDGYFMLKPGHEEGLALFVKMAFHFHMGWENICPDCGESVEGPFDDWGFKKYYRCDCCQSFWVQSVCWNRMHTKQRLYKYLYRNFHRSTAHDWDVHCPRCELTYADYLRGR
ncbi:hypothetical protein [Neobacillus drentensis]|uniref:hypothetical protein n=1 Tax=Neobacillus drentensis TaxID=220684 RepID=UPI00300064DA